MPKPFIFITAHTDVLNINKAKNTSPEFILSNHSLTKFLLVAIEIALHKRSWAIMKYPMTCQKLMILFFKDSHVFIKDG